MEARGVSIRAYWPVAVLFLIQLVLGTERVIPLIAADEFGYMGSARWLAGGSAITLELAGTYSGGYSLFLVPCFWLFEEPYAVYRAVLVTNALILSTTYLFLYGFLKELGHDHKESLQVSLASCLAPAVLFRSALAMSEVAFIPVFAALMWTAAKLARQVTPGRVTALCLLTVFCFSIHQRAAGMVVPVVPAYLVYLFYRKRLKAPILISGLLLIGLGVAVSWSVFSHLVELQMGADVRQNFAVWVSEEGYLSRFPSVLVGQLWYLLVSSAGLVLVGLRWMRSRWREDKDREVMAFYALCAASILAISVLGVMSFVDRNKGWVLHGRYTEGFIIFLLAFGMLGVRRGEARKDLPPLLFFLAAGLMILQRFDPEYAKVVLFWESPGYQPLFDLLQDPGTAALAAAGGLGLASWLHSERRPWLPVAGLGLYFLALSAGTYQACAAPMHLPYLARAVSQVPGERVCFELDGRTAWEFEHLQFFLPEKEVKAYLPEREESYTSGSILVLPKERKAPPGYSLHYRGPLMSVWVPGRAGVAEGMNLLWRPADVRMEGFAEPEWSDNCWTWWTLGKASLRLQPPYADVDTLVLDLNSTTRRLPLTVRCNGQALFSERVGPGGEGLALKLPQLARDKPLTIELESPTLTAAQRGYPSSADQRTLGVRLRGVHLVRTGAQPWQRAYGRQRLTVSAPEHGTAQTPVRLDLLLCPESDRPLGCGEERSRLAVVWRRGDKNVATERVPFPQTVRAGEFSYAAVLSHPRGPGGEPLEPGRYSVLVRFEWPEAIHRDGWSAATEVVYGFEGEGS